MNRILKTLALATFALLLSSTGRAESLGTVTSLTCYEANGTKLTVPAYANTFDVGTSLPGYFSVYTTLSNFYTFAYDEILGIGFNYCQFANMKGTTASNVNVADVSAYGVGANVGLGGVSEDTIAQTYARVTFSYDGVGVGPNAVKTGPLATPEEQKHNLELFKASIPPLPKQ